MEVVSQLSCSGLVHWGEREVKWTVLGDTGEQEREHSQWWNEGVGTRTKAATSKFFGWWRGEGIEGENVVRDGCDFEGEKQNTASNNNAQDNLTNYDNSDNDNEDRKDTTKEVEDISKFELKEGEYNNNNPSYLDTLGIVTKNTLSSLVNFGSLTVAAVAGKASEECEDHEEEPLLARSARVLRERQIERASHTGVVNSDVVEEIGTCPMCGKEMGMDKLLVHAVACQGMA
eukprot:GFUD01002941.1.p1 GENE.GFUD01002941.1~~GFUD01002941.1.p1  ORF type:complete len:243 (+),score=69.46 GFUD01002941.1:39-731(+)